MADSTSNIDQISSTQANKELTMNALTDAASPSMLWGRRASTSAGLTWGYYGGRFVDSTGTAHAISNGTITVGASTTTYVMADAVTGAVSSNTTGFTTGKVPLYSLVSNASQITIWLDYRSYQPSAVGASSGVGLAGGAIQTAAYTFVSGDKGQCLVMNSGSAVSQALPSPGGAGFGNQWWASVDNIGAGTTTLTVPTGVKLDGVTNGTLALAQNTGVTFFTNGTDYFTIRGLGSGGGGGGMTNPMTTLGDLITGGSGGTPQRLGIGGAGAVLTVVSGAPAWASPTGSAGVSLGTLMVPSGITRPAIGTFSWLNQGTSTAVDHANGPLTITPSAQVGDQIRGLHQAVPGSTPWTVTAQIDPLLWDNSYYNAGVYLYDSGSGKISLFSHQAQVSSGIAQHMLVVNKWSSTTSFSSVSKAIGIEPRTPLWLRIKNDGTNLTYYTSTNGADWIQFYQEAVGAFMPAITSAGIGGDVNYAVASGGETGSSATTPQINVLGFELASGTGTNTSWIVGGFQPPALPVDAQTGTSYTLALTDAPAANGYQGVVTMNNASANTLTVPPNSSVAFPVGAQVQVTQLGAGQTSVAAGSGVTVNTPSTLNARARYSTLVLTQVAANSWVLGGDMA